MLQHLIHADAWSGSRDHADLPANSACEHFGVTPCVEARDDDDGVVLDHEEQAIRIVAQRDPPQSAWAHLIREGLLQCAGGGLLKRVDEPESRLG